jgi:hypothetical protein
MNASTFNGGVGNPQTIPRRHSQRHVQCLETG